MTDDGDGAQHTHGGGAASAATATVTLLACFYVGSGNHGDGDELLVEILFLAVLFIDS